MRGDDRQQIRKLKLHNEEERDDVEIDQMTTAMII